MADGEDTVTDNRQERIDSLRAELQQLESEGSDELGEALTEAETTVTEVADESSEAVSDAHETLREAEHEVSEAVHEAADDVAETVAGVSADEVAEHLFCRMEERGVLPAAHHEEIHAETASAPAVAPTVAEEVPATEETVVTPDDPPEHTHWYYRKRSWRR